MLYKRLRDLQKKNNLTNQQVAEAVGHSRQWYSEIFKNKSLKVEDLKRLAELYKVPIAKLFKDIYNEMEEGYSPSNIIENAENINELISLNRKSLEALLDLTIQLKESREENKELLKELNLIKSK